MLEGHVVLAAGWIVFCVLHSVLADLTIKKKIYLAYPSFTKWYRAIYTVVAFITLAIVAFYQIALESPLLFEARTVYTIMGGCITLAGAVVMMICIKKYFLSLSGLKSLFANRVVANNLRVDGIHRYVRHPLYLGTFLFIWGAFVLLPLASILIACLIITGYTLVGIRLEEKKLVGEFGDAYRQYMQSVPRLLPFTKMNSVS
ncbi:MAG: isoprenylcysteine carboxylmethyltransferase family protein [Chitinophagaceae bacterium]